MSLLTTGEEDETYLLERAERLRRYESALERLAEQTDWNPLEVRKVAREAFRIDG